MKTGAIAPSVALLCGCTYATQTASIPSAAAEVRTDQHIHGTAILRFDPQFDSLTVDAKKNSFACSAHKYPSTIGPAIKESVRRAFAAVFDGVDVTQDAASNPNAVVLNIREESYTPIVSFAEGFWSAKASAQSEIVIRVDAEKNGRQVLYPVTVDGEGSAFDLSGGCSKGAQAVDQANEAALKRLTENLAYRVINNGDLKRAVEGSSSRP